MKDKDNTKPSIFKTLLEAGETTLQAQIHKAKNSMVMNQAEDDDLFHAKTLTEEPIYSTHTAGYKDKPNRLQNGHLKQMSLKNTIAAAIIQTRQNQAAAHSRLVQSEQEKGFMLELRDKESLIEEIKVQLREEMQNSPENEETIVKANGDNEVAVETESDDDTDRADQQSEDSQKTDDDVEEFDWELERKAKELLRKKFEKEMRAAEQYILNCGKLEKRPFDKRKWNFDAALRAWTRDTYTYDLYASEVVPDNANRPHYWYPVDGGTIKYASVDLNKYKNMAETFTNLDILYPERQARQVEKKKVVELDDALLAKDMYKWVQVAKGRIERAYTDDELKVGIRNLTTDIYNNGYGLSELELAIGLITGHLNAEFYNQAYFTQGFSAKGILHIKAAINRRKLESVRQQWQHMIRGTKNSFQTPIFAGVNEVQWIPLTQNHQDIGFEGWMRYLIKMICSIYQIDPHEIGIGFKDEGGSGGGITGDNTKEKMDQSKDKGLVPLMRHFETYINESILRQFDDRFVIRFTGLTTESKEQALDRQEREVKFKKTVNEIREEDGLPPIPGMDDVILSQEFLTWYAQFSKKAEEMMDKTVEQEQAAGGEEESEFHDDEESFYNDQAIETNIMDPEPGEDPVAKASKYLLKSRRLKKSKKKKKKLLKVEHYGFDDGES